MKVQTKERRKRIQHNAFDHHETNRFLYALTLGFWAGVIWGAVKILFFLFEFSQVLPSYLVKPWLRKDIAANWTGHLIGWIAFIAMSILAALIYTYLLSKVKGPWLGMVYGLAWWGLIYFLIGPILTMTPYIDQLKLDTMFTDGCLFLLWGLFIGYSAAFEFNDERSRVGKGPMRIA